MNETNKIFNLQHALVQINYRVSKEEFENLEITKNQFEASVKAEIIKQLTNHVISKFKIDVNVDDGNSHFTSRGYILSEREMLNTILEIIDMDDVQKENMKKAIEKQLGM